MPTSCYAQRGAPATETRNISRKGAKVTGGGPSSRVKARDLRKVSPGVYPERAEGIEMTKIFLSELGVFAPWRETSRDRPIVTPVETGVHPLPLVTVFQRYDGGCPSHQLSNQRLCRCRRDSQSPAR